MIRILANDEFELYSQNKYYGMVRVEDIPDQPGVGNFHIYIRRFSHNVLNQMRRDEESLMSYIKNAGYRELNSFVDINHVKHGDLKLWTKFVKLFEFDEPILFTRRTI